MKSFMHQKPDGDYKIWKKKNLVISKKKPNMFFVFKIEIMCNMFYGSGFADIQTFNSPNCARRLSHGCGIFWARRLITTGPILVSISWNCCFQNFFSTGFVYFCFFTDLINCLLFTIFVYLLKMLLTFYLQRKSISKVNPSLTQFDETIIWNGRKKNVKKEKGKKKNMTKKYKQLVGCSRTSWNVKPQHVSVRVWERESERPHTHTHSKMYQRKILEMMLGNVKTVKKGCDKCTTYSLWSH